VNNSGLANPTSGLPLLFRTVLINETATAIMRVLFADSNQLIACGLQAALAADPRGVEFLGTCETGENLRDRVKMDQPDIVVLDFAADGFSIGMIPQLKKWRKGLRVLALTFERTGMTIVDALRAGADGFVKKDCSLDEIVDAVHEVGLGGKFFCTKIVEAIRREGIDLESLETVDDSCLGIRLSKRELEVLRLIADGYTNPQISKCLFVSPHTVTTHRKNILGKLGVNNTASLVMYAVKQGLVCPNKFLFAPSSEG
jgi:DNA-binding NarL/FixJ family response regulator